MQERKDCQLWWEMSARMFCLLSGQLLGSWSTQMPHRDVTPSSLETWLWISFLFSLQKLKIGCPEFLTRCLHINIYLPFFFNPAWLIGPWSLNISFQKDLVPFKNISIDWQILIRILRNEKAGGLGFRLCNWKNVLLDFWRWSFSVRGPIYF